MAKAAKPTPADLELWRRVVEQVRPLPGRRRPAAPPSPVASPAPEPLRRQPEPARPQRPLPAAEPRPLAHGVVADLDRRSAERLTRGKLPIDGRLDLHGMTQADAHAALIRFIGVSRGLGRRCVLIITGKGRSSREEGGVLRRQVPLWLNQAGLRTQILAFNYSQPQHGGDGALYVLLRRQR